MTCSTTAVPSDISITQAESKTLLLYVSTLDDQEAVNLTSVKIYLTIKSRFEDVAPVVLKRTTSAGGASGEVVIVAPQATEANTGYANIYLTPADTEELTPGKTYWLDAWVKLANGEERPVVRKRKVTIEPRVTRIP